MKHATRCLIADAVLEVLEDRRLLSSVTFDGEVLKIVGDAAAANHLAVNLSADGLTVTASANGIASNPIAVAQLKQIDIYGGSLNDLVALSPNLGTNAFIDVGAGNDTVTGGAGNDTIHGGIGNDSVHGNSGSDIVYGEAGNDSLFGGLGSDTLQGGAGRDYISGGGRAHDTRGQRDSDNLVTGTGTDTVVAGPGGDDTASIGNTGDVLRGSANGDSTSGGTGGDTTNGGAGGDTTSGGTGGDTTSGGTGGDTTSGGTGGDTTSGGTGGDTTNGGSGGDTTNGGSGGDTTNGGSGGDTTNGGTGGDTTNGGTGGDTVQPVDPQAPLPLMQFISASGVVNHAVHVQATGSQLMIGAPEDARYQWDFGDPSGSYNSLEGFNAAHIYDAPGTYTVTLRVVNSGGKQATQTAQVTIAPDNRRVVYVDANGSDANSGLSPAEAVHSLLRVQQLLASNTAVLFARNETFDLSTAGLTLGYDNLLIGAYGTGADPVLRYTGSTTSSDMGLLTLNASRSSNITIQNLTFDSIYPAAGDIANKLPFVSVLGGGVNIAVRNCTFLNVGGAVTSQNVHGLLLQDNQAPLATGVRSYFLWLEGSDAVVLGNTVANSTREHVLRTGNNAGPTGFQRLLIAHNDFTNLDRSSVDAQDIRKTTLTIMAGSYAWVQDNHLTKGVVCFGPIFNANTTRPEERTDYVVFRDNLVNYPDDISSISNAVIINPGTQHMRLAYNTILNGHISVSRYDVTNARGAVDLAIKGNLVNTQGTAGRLVYFADSTAQDVLIKNNVLVAPNLARGAGQSAGIWCAGTSLAFAQISGNVYSLPPISYYQTTACYVGAPVGAAQWLAQFPEDQFQSLTLPADAVQITVNGVSAGVAWGA